MLLLAQLRDVRQAASQEHRLRGGGGGGVSLGGAEQRGVIEKIEKSEFLGTSLRRVTRVRNGRRAGIHSRFARIGLVRCCRCGPVLREARDVGWSVLVWGEGEGFPSPNRVPRNR